MPYNFISFLYFEKQIIVNVNDQIAFSIFYFLPSRHYYHLTL